MLNRIVRSDKNQIVTLQVLNELRPVKIQPAIQALEKNLASRPAQKVVLDLNNLQVLSQATQELLGLLVRHMRLQNIPISFSGNAQLDPAILLAISEGRPVLHEASLTPDEEDDSSEELPPKFFSRFSAPPFFAQKPKTSSPTASEAVSGPQSVPEITEAVAVPADQKQPPEQQEGVPETTAEEAGNVPQKEATSEPYDEYKLWFRIGMVLLIGLTGVALTLFILLWPKLQSGEVWRALSAVPETSLISENELSAHNTGRSGDFSVQESSPAALMQAVEKKNLPEVKRLLLAGVSPEYKDRRGHTPLMRAVKLQNVDLVKLLVKHGAEVNRSDKFGDTPLVWAASMGDSAIVSLLTEHGANPDRGNFTPLMWAAFHGDLPMLEQFLRAQANLNARTREGWTALMWAAEQGNIQVLWKLLENGARVNMQNQDGQTALILAARRGRTGAVSLLLKKGGEASLVDFDKKTALDHARLHQRAGVIRLLEKELGQLSY